MAHYGVLCLDQGSLSVRASLVAGWDQLAEEMKSNAQPFVSPDHRAAAGGLCRSDALACAQTFHSMVAGAPGEQTQAGWTVGEECVGMPNARQVISRGVVQEWEDLAAIWCAALPRRRQRCV